ncbi:type IV leader peptidase family protein [Tepidamorphus gemmatus]|uniref:Type IV leader peptidase family protein n=1 Tax=Tepidamorphus gemmatus TaxID=747076 RepID=A0A4R3MB31_9HYPH|nr:A24 family peptidase [Tepidamorphus gemmatus]TCT10720.1 type IV leader peptidase family protein [Tepidamorphus gemmatus]
MVEPALVLIAACGGGLVGRLVAHLAVVVPRRVVSEAMAEARAMLCSPGMPCQTTRSFDFAPKHRWEGVVITVLSVLIWTLATVLAETAERAFACACVGSVLLLLAIIDGRSRLLPDMLVLPLLWGGLLFSALGGSVAPADAILGAAMGYGGLMALAIGYGAIRRKEVLGAGDAKLVAALGAWLGWMALPTVLAIAVAVGLLYSAVALATRRMAFDSRMPMGPFLGLAGWAVMLVEASRSLPLGGP